MARFFKDRSNSFGQVPGSLVFIGRRKLENPQIRYIEYDHTGYTDVKLENINQYTIDTNNTKIDWINITGLHDLELIKSAGDLFSIDPLSLEDILNTDQRPKVEDYGNYLIFVIKILKYNREQEKITADQLSIILGNNFVLTFQEEPTHLLLPLIDRIVYGKGRVRNCGVDYLAFSIIDAIVDSYIFFIEEIGDKIEDLEHYILNHPVESTMKQILNFKTELNFLRKGIRPLRELLSEIKKIESPLINKKTIKYFRDLQDHINQANEAIETYNLIVTDQLNIYNTNISIRANDIMKVLTIFSAVFIPLTFLAGVYGTNFEYMPELKYKYGYLFFWVVIISTAVSMIIIFKKKKWI